MNNRISIWNKTAEKITGYKQIEVLNRSVGKLPVFSKPKDLTKNIELVCGKKHSQSIDVVLQTKENDKLILRMSGSKIYSSDKECVGALFVGKDITKEVELHKKLLEGNSYLIKAKNKLPAIDLIVDLTINAFKGLIVTRGNPEQIKRQIPESKNIEIILLTNQHITGLSTIASLEKLKETFIDFTKKNKKSVILLDGIHYLLSHFSFDEFIKLLYDVNDVAAKNKALLFVRIDPSTIDRHRMAFLENELLVLPNQQTEDLMITDEIYNILKYIYEQNQNNAIVSVKKIMGKFDITYVTAASRLDSLEARGLIYTKKQGKLRTIYIARKGKELIHKRKTA